MTVSSQAIGFARSGESVLLTAAGFALTIYLGTSPLFWLPNINVGIVGILKLSLAAVGVLSVYAHGILKSTLRFPTGIVGPIGFILVVALSLPGLAQSDLGAALARIGDFVLSFGFLWCFYNYVRAGGDWRRIFRGALYIIVALSAITLSNALFGVPEWNAPLANGTASLSTTGFGFKRTGWSNGIAMFVPVAFLLISNDKTRLGRFGGFMRVFIVIALILGAQIAAGGRSGIVAALMSLGVFALRSRLRFHFVIVFIVVAAAVYASSDYLIDQFRLGSIQSSNVSVEDLDRLSSGRVVGYMVAVDLIAAKPFMGHGFEQITLEQFGIGYQEVHNMWLQLWVESGIGFAAGFALIVLAILRRAWDGRKYRRSQATKHAALALGLVVASGLVVSMFEPRTLLGSFQNTAIWWAAAGVLLGNHVASRQQIRTVPASTESAVCS